MSWRSAPPTLTLPTRGSGHTEFVGRLVNDLPNPPHKGEGTHRVSGTFPHETRHLVIVKYRTRRTARGDRRHRCGDRRPTARESRRCCERPAQGGARKAHSQRQEWHGRNPAGQVLPHRPCAV